MNTCFICDKPIEPAARYFTPDGAPHHMLCLPSVVEEPKYTMPSEAELREAADVMHRARMTRKRVSATELGRERDVDWVIAHALSVGWHALLLVADDMREAT